MLTHADRTPGSTRGSVTASVSRRQGSGDFAAQLAGRPRVAALRKQQERANNSPQVRRLNALREMANHRSAQPIRQSPARDAAPGEPVQLKKREAKVTWAITHLVQVQDESLFGADWQAGEVPPDQLGQLSHDQLIEVDDAQVFMSRRGPNQEKQTRRDQDEDADELKYEWLKVLRVFSEGEWREVPEDTYVRAETIRFVGDKKLQAITINPQKDEGFVSGELADFHAAWNEAAGNRRRSVGHFEEVVPDDSVDGADISSGWNWDKYDEGQNVSEAMMDPEARTGGGFEGQHVLSANYDTEPGKPAAAYMVIEVRQNSFENEGQPFMYLRWLIGHPERGGGASVLVREAIRRFDESGLNMMRVDSAYSAVGWYLGLGFEKVNPGQNVVRKKVGYADTELVYRKKK